MPPVWRFVLTGFAMGAADVVPGVSGGTVALLCGIYPRLLRAVTRFNWELVVMVRQRRWRDAAAHVDLRLLGPLAMGLVVGLVCSILSVKRLLDNDLTRAPTLGLFCGMIVASACLLILAIKPQRASERARVVVAMGLGVSLAAWIGLLPASPTDTQPAAWFVFGCGMLGICAMILPGISGAMILLLLGLYGYLLALPDKLMAGNISEGLSSLVLFALGCAAGLALFSRLLSWMLERHHFTTLSLLAGLMIGSLVRLWPFQTTVADDHHESLALRWPVIGETETWLAMLAVVLGVGSIFAVQWLARSMLTKHQSLQEAKPND